MQALCSSTSKMESALDEYERACNLLSTYPYSRPVPSSLRDMCHEVDEDWRKVVSFERRINEMKSALGKIRNTICPLIYTLPSEILRYIFHFVIAFQSLDFDELVGNNKLPRNVLAVSQVCSQWRRISLESLGLWTHINLSVRKEFVPLGRLFVARSGNLPLSVRMVQRIEVKKTWETNKTDPFFRQIGPRLESIDLAVVMSLRPQDIVRAIKLSLAHCTPGRLTQLVISDRNIYVDEGRSNGYYDSATHWFIFHSDLHASVVKGKQILSLNTGIDEQLLEDIFLHIKVLKLDRVYPHWTSKAYHGLTELRLIGPPRLSMVITDKLFANILAASPELRVLHFGLEMQLTGTILSPIQLDYLEEFLLQSILNHTQQAVLRLILPGTKSLLMSTTYRGDIRMPAQVEDELCRFFKRSNIVRLQVHSDLLEIDLPNLLQLLPSLDTLIFRSVCLLRPPLSDCEMFTAPLCPRLRELHLICVEIELEALRWLVSTHDLRRVVIWGSAISRVGGNEFIESNQGIPVGVCSFAEVLGTANYANTIKIKGWGEDIDDRMSTASLKDYAAD
ncbi:hypothetical protein RSOLAG1IB_10638 [Rhizoctonia solani AG-1 IB]|uniref:F-box domain-containing protein n=1 Tax=Thanatephorus cucumeris (strain AG1-IB / isolate 7/3/14) TaxID=1108050 RepID=A0A0B7G1M8_THACB|nr:hypothetical protein RSOLAG1IB_10638 [Rhizoctonia solani AG-1 IB]